MAIKIKGMTSKKVSAVKEFTDRTEPRKAFWERYMKMVSEGSTIINFYGAGGVGKTALLKKLEEEINYRNKTMAIKCKYIKYDFSLGTDTREVLNTLKFQLSNYGCEFPFFDTGNYYYSLKVGQEITPPKATSMLEKIPWVQSMKKNLSKAGTITGTIMPVIGTINKAINVAINEEENLVKLFLKGTSDFLSSSIPVMRTMTTFMAITDNLLMKYLERKKLLDEDTMEIRFQLNALRQNKNPNALYEYLPTLFAIDVNDWLKESGNKLVVILDNYESLISATSFATSEQLKHDLWLRGDEGIIFRIPSTLWTIAGRNKLRWDGELDDEIEHHLITALSPEDSDWFLQRAGIFNKTLRSELVNLTEGYPIFLDLCVDVYFAYKRKHNAEPSISEFGQKREEVVGRIFRYIDADKDDAAKDMLEFLCVLNAWTDEIAIEVGGAVLCNFSRNTYKRVKNFSFIKSERVKKEDVSLTIFRFDKTIQGLLVPIYDEKLISDEDTAEHFKKLIADVKTATSEHFKKKFTNSKASNSQKIFYLKGIYLKLWSEFIVRLADNANELSEQYKGVLNEQISMLINNAHFDTAEEILKLFIDKLKSLGDKDSVVYANFELDLGWLRRTQGKYKEAYEITKFAYEKLTRLLGEKNIDIVKAMHKFAISLGDVGNYKEAAELQEKVLAFRKIFLGDKHPDTLNAMNNLAVSLNTLGRYDEALKLQEENLKLSKEILGDKHPDTLNAMNNLAVSLNTLGRYDEALKLQEENLKLSKEILGEEHPDTLAAMNNLANSLRDIGRHDKALELLKRVLALNKKILGEEHPNTLDVMNNLANLLRDIGRHGKALKLKKKLLALRKKIFGNEHPNTLKAMNNLAISLSDIGCYNKSLKLQEKVLTLIKNEFGEEHPNTLDAMNNLAWTLTSLNRHDEALKLREKILLLTKNEFGDEHLNTLDAMNNLAWTLTSLNRHDEALKLQEKILTLIKNEFGNEHPNTLDAMNNLAWTLTSLNRHDEALKLIETTLTLYKEIIGEENPAILGSVDTMAHALNGLGRYKEAIELQRNALAKCKKNWSKNNSLTIVSFTKSLAENLLKNGEREEAIQLMDEMLEKIHKTFGNKNPEMKRILNAH